MKFQELNINESILKALDEIGYESPTPIQEQAIPPVLEGRDVLGCAQTGTGKTAAFAIPILQRLGTPREKQSPKRPIRSLILTPTRELALQIYENFVEYGKYTGHSAAVIFGGVSQVPQLETLRRGVDVLIATPGRLWDLMGQKKISLSGIECFVLDEADRMLDMGFFPDVKRIIHTLPAQRQTLLFSATMPSEIAHLADSLLKNPVHISVTPESPTVDRIRQYVYMVDRCNKRKLLAHVLRENGLQQTLVFTRTKHGADRVARELKRGNIQADAIHGDKSQGARQRALGDFKAGRTVVLVATDIAARGIDINGLPFVINFDLPEVPETYIHRIGRTGRAGLDGIAISFCDEAQMSYLIDIEELTGKRIEEVEDHVYPMTGEQAAQPEPHKQNANKRNNARRPQQRKNQSGQAHGTRPQTQQQNEAKSAGKPAQEQQPKKPQNRRRRPSSRPAEGASQQTAPRSQHAEQGTKAQNSPRKPEENKPHARGQQPNSSQKMHTPGEQKNAKSVRNNRRRSAGSSRGGRRDNQGAQVETKPLPARPLSDSVRARVAAKVASVMAGRKNP